MFQPGTLLGPYQIVGPLGAGGMGNVYRAHDPRIARDVAIKVLAEEHAHDPRWRHRLEQEARAAGRLNHSNVAAIFDIGDVPAGLPCAGSPFLVMELLTGQSLRDVLSQDGVSVTRALDYSRQVALGLSVAHQNGIVHRDLKPDNLFVTPQGVIKILDFGIAKLELSESEATRTRGTDPGAVMGTVSYMSPEQTRGLRVDHRSDIFSLGVVLYEMVTGAPPFRRATAADTMTAILTEDPAPIPVSAGGVDCEPLNHLLRRCLEKLPKDRFQSAQDLAFSMESLLRPNTSHSRTTQAPRSRLSAGAAAVLLGLVTIGLLGGTLRVRHEAPDESAPEPPRLAPLISTPAVEANPAWSPKGDLIAYVSDANGNPDVWISDPQNSRAINLTKDHTGVDSFPAWSPDSTRIAFYSEREGGGVFVMSSLGGDVRRMTAVKPSVLYTFSLRWASDGRILYTDFDAAGNKQVLAISAETGALSCMTCGINGLGAGRAGDLSPSGRLLALTTSAVDALSTVLVLDLQAHEFHRISSHSDWPQWRGDDRLAFVSLRDGLADLWEVAVNPKTGSAEGLPYRLTSGFDVSVAGPFSIRPDGRAFLLVKEKTSGQLWTFRAAGAHVRDLAQGERLTTGESRDSHPRWLPGEPGIIFQSDRRGSVDVWTLGAAGQTPARLSSLGSSSPLSNAYRPAVSPVDPWIAVEVVGERGEFPYLIRPNGAGLHPLDAQWPDRYEHVCCLDWSADGRQVALSYRTRSGRNSLGMVSLDPSSGTTTSEIHPLLTRTGLSEYPKWSPDGRFISYEAFSEGSWDIWIVDNAGKDPRRLTHFPGNEKSTVWGREPLAIYFRRDFNEIWRLPMTPEGTPSGPAEQWMAFPGKTFDHGGLDFDRNGERAVVTLLTRASDLWLAELPPGRR